MSDRREWTAERHAAAWDRCNRATSGPWKWWTSNSHRRLTAEDRQDGGVAYGTQQRDGCGDIVIGEHDMAFIEEARLDLPDALAEIERLSRSEAACVREALEQVGGARAERDEARAERDLMRAGRRRAAQTLIAEIGAAGPEDIEETAKRAVKEIRRLKADLLLLGALKSEEVAPVIERFRAAFGADVPQAPSGKRALTFERAIQIGEKVHGLYPSEAAAVLLAEFGEPAKVVPPVRRARHDRHCMIHDGVGCSREPGCEVEP